MIKTFMNCPDIKPDCEIWPDYNEREDICFNMSVDGRNAHNCLELCTCGKCPRGFRR